MNNIDRLNELAQHMLQEGHADSEVDARLAALHIIAAHDRLTRSSGGDVDGGAGAA